MKIFIATVAVLVALAGADFDEADFLVTAQKSSNSFQSQTYDEAVICANFTNFEIKRLADAIEAFKADCIALAQSLQNPALPVAAVTDQIDSLIAVVRDRIDQFDFGSQIIAAVVGLNNQIGVSVSAKIERFDSYLKEGGTEAHCFVDELPKINENVEEVVEKVRAALKKFSDDQSEEVDDWIEKMSDALAILNEDPSLSQIEETVTALVAEGLSSSFWEDETADLDAALEAIVDDANNRIEQIKTDIDACI